MQSFYVDTCVYLNLWKKEVEKKGNPLWLIAERFFEKTKRDNSIIYYSGFLLKELMFILNTEEYLSKRELFDSSPRFKKTILSKEEYREAQKLKNISASDISFFDILNIFSAKKTRSILITRDKEIIELARTLDVEVKKPEEVL